MATDQELVEKYGFVGSLALTIPELKGILEQADAGDWTTEKFQFAVQDSAWWKTSSEQRRQWQTLYATDPATFNQNWAVASDKIKTIATEMGYWDSTSSQHWAMAEMAITGGWDDDQIRNSIARNWKPVANVNGAFLGELGDTMAQYKAMASAYGIPVTDAMATIAARDQLSGYRTGVDWELDFRQQAKNTYSHLAAQLDQGMTLRDIADPYIAQMAQTLEINPANINLSDRHIKRALDTTVPATGVRSTQPLWAFERSLKDDARWDKTENARNEAWDIVAQVGRDFGMVT